MEYVLEDPAEGNLILPKSFTIEKMHEILLKSKIFERDISLSCMKSYFYALFKNRCKCEKRSDDCSECYASNQRLT